MSKPKLTKSCRAEEEEEEVSNAELIRNCESYTEILTVK